MSCRSINLTDDINRSSKQVRIELQKNRLKNKDIYEEETHLKNELQGLLKQQAKVTEAI